MSQSIELDDQDLQRLEEELEQWQQNSFTTETATTFFPGQPFQHHLEKPPTAFQTPSPLARQQNEPEFTNGHRDIYIGSELDDPLGLYGPASAQKPSAAPSNQQFPKSRNGPPALSGPEWNTNHQLELDQMEALAQLSMEEDLNYQEQSFASHFPVRNHEYFPTVDPPAPISSPSFHQNHNQDLEHEKHEFSSPIMNNHDNERSFSSPIITNQPSPPLKQSYQPQQRFSSSSSSSSKNGNYNNQNYNVSELLLKISRLEQEKSNLLDEFGVERDKLLAQISRTDASLAAIKNALQKEHQMDLLQLKKDLLAQKERQLESLKDEMRTERESMEHRMQDQMMMREKQWQHERDILNRELDYAKKHAALAVDKVAEFVQTDFLDSNSFSHSIQLSKLRDLNGDLQEKESELQMCLAAKETEISKKTEENVKLFDQVQKWKTKAESLSESLAKLKRKTAVPDPMEFADKENQIFNEKSLVSRDALVKEIEERYSRAYEAAIQHLKNSYSNLTKKLREKSEEAQTDAIERVRRELENVIHETESNLLKERSESLLLKEHVKDLETQLQRQRDQHQKAMEEMKRQYLSTLKQMRDDVAQSKARSVDRVKDAWMKKKDDLERAWRDKFAELKGEYEMKLKESSQLRKSTTIRDSRPLARFK